MTVSFVIGAAMLLAFLAWEARTKYPILPLAHFKRRGFSTANAVIFFQGMSLIGSLFLITQLFQIGLGYNALQAGIRILVWTGTPLLIAPAAGAFSDKIGNKPFMFGGLLLQGLGLAWLSLAVKPGVG